MKIDIHREGNLVVMSISGRLDIRGVPLLESSYQNLLKTNPSIIAFQFKNCTYIDSTGINTLIRCMNSAEGKNLELVIYDLPEPVLGIFRISKIDQYFKIITEEEFLLQYASQ